MSKSYKTEGIVLRGIRYGESDRILHIYSETHGRIGAIAKGARKASSRFGGRLEPFFRLELVLYRGRGDLSTVTAAATIEPHTKMRGNRKALNAATGGSQTVLRLMPESEQNVPAYNLICRYLSLLEGFASDGAEVDWGVLELAFRMKLLVVAGIAPELFRCVSCGSDGRWERFSPQDGGVVCKDCAGNDFTIDSRTLKFLRDAMTKPMIDLASRKEKNTKLVDRAIREIAEYHAHVSLAKVA